MNDPLYLLGSTHLKLSTNKKLYYRKLFIYALTDIFFLWLKRVFLNTQVKNLQITWFFLFVDHLRCVDHNEESGSSYAPGHLKSTKKFPQFLSWDWFPMEDSIYHGLKYQNRNRGNFRNRSYRPYRSFISMISVSDKKEIKNTFKYFKNCSNN